MHLKSKKSLGQNFLLDKNIQRKIIQNCNFQSSDKVLEIGAGRGELTKSIAEQVKFVYALEIDADFLAAFAVSNNTRNVFDLAETGKKLGFYPQDDAEKYF